MVQTSALPNPGSFSTALATVRYNTPVTLSTAGLGDRTITLEEVSWHDTPSDCWVVIYDRVYDVTDFLDEHPGGSDILLENAGRDASCAFRGSGHSAAAVHALNRFLIGELPMEERIFRKTAGYRICISDLPE